MASTRADAASTGTLNAAGGLGNGAALAPPPNADGLTSQGDYSPCNQECWYQAANRNLTLQALYIKGKIDAMKVIFDQQKFDALNGNDQQAKLTEIAGLLGNDCKEDEVYNKPTATTPPGAAGGPVNAAPTPTPDPSNFNRPGIKACAERYIHTQEPILRQIRESIKYNNDAIAKLANTRNPKLALGIDPGAPPAGTGMQFKNVPYLPTLEDLAKVHQRAAAQNEFDISIQTFEWAGDLLQAPKQEDFVQIAKAEAAFPGADGKRAYYYIDENQAGRPQSESVAYQAAKDDYEAKRKGRTTGGKTGGRDITMDINDFKEIDKERQQGKIPLPGKDLLGRGGATQQQQDLYNQVRFKIVQVGNKKLQSISSTKFPGNTVTANVGGTSRGPAGGQQGNLTGKEQIDPSAGGSDLKFNYDPAQFETDIDSIIKNTTNPQ